MNGVLTKQSLIQKITAAFVLMLLVMTVCSFVGTEKISLKAVLTGPNVGAEPNPDYEIFVHFRLPRILLAAIVGASLASAGVVLQAILRNPLADPYILGISSGAALGAIIALLCGMSWTLWGRSPVAVFAFIGAIGAVWLVWAIGSLAGRGRPTGLLLAGVVVNAFFSAVIMFLVSIARSSQVHSTIFWLMGNMQQEEFFVLWLGATLTGLGIIILMRICPQLNALSFGDADAQNLGVTIFAVRLIAFAVAAFITAIAVSLSGLVGFVGLIVPHGARLVFGPDHRQLLPLSAIVGATFLVLADTLARIVAAPAQLPVGVVTAVIGGPFFLILLVKHSRKLNWFNA
ncbi:MAG: iron ABC transporter permease [Planctomycetota bacterium]